MSESTVRVESTLDLFRQATRDNFETKGRQGNCQVLTPDDGDEVFIFADLHGDRLNFNQALRLASLEQHPRRHLVMQEVCHGGPEYPSAGGCMSHLMLEDVARLKTQFPDRFHFLLSNHELAEIAEYPITKGRRMLNLLFRNGIAEMYGADVDRVRNAYVEFLKSCPFAVRLSTGVFISHSLPDHCDLHPFDATLLERPVKSTDWQPGSDLFRLVWGRDFRLANAIAFAQSVRADVLIHGHEPCTAGFAAPNEKQIILDGCGRRACYLSIPLDRSLSHTELVRRITTLHGAMSNGKTAPIKCPPPPSRPAPR